MQQWEKRTCSAFRILKTNRDFDVCEAMGAVLQKRWLIVQKIYPITAKQQGL